jgi:hypothetical protein
MVGIYISDTVSLLQTSYLQRLQQILTACSAATLCSELVTTATQRCISVDAQRCKEGYGRPQLSNAVDLWSVKIITMLCLGPDCYNYAINVIAGLLNECRTTTLWRRDLYTKRLGAFNKYIDRPIDPILLKFW